jgi:DNA gyrase/topoisomerase IV subunit A
MAKKAPQTTAVPVPEASSRLFQDVMTEHFLSYSLRVISDRALPSAVDGLKPVQRRILWNMYASAALPTAKHRKCARVVGDTLGKYHPHSDGSVYGALVNLTSQYTLAGLVDTQGNFGIRGEDPPAASRYTECRLHTNAMSLFLDDLEEDCVDFRLNYDQTLNEPVALPAKIPMLLVNGSQGIAVSIASTIPSHNLAEVSKMAIAVLDGKPEKAINYFSGPDWHEPCQIYMSASEREKIFNTGRGSLKVYGVLEKIPATGRSKVGHIKIWSIPWITNRQKIIEQILSLRDEIPDMRLDKSLKAGEPRITIETKEDLDRVEKLLLKKTLLSTSFSYNLTYLDGKLPKQTGFVPMIQLWLNFRRTTLKRKFEIQLAKVQRELQFLEAKQKLTDETFNAFVKKLRSSTRAETKAWLVIALETDEDTAERILASRVSIFSRDSDADFFEKLQIQRDRASSLQTLISDAVSLDAYIRNELLSLGKLSAKRQIELLKEDIALQESSTNLLTRRLTITQDFKIQLGVGERYQANDSFAVITDTEAYRIRVRDFRKFRDGAIIDLTTFGISERPPITISKDDPNFFFSYADGRAFVVNLAKVRGSSVIRTFERSEAPVAFCYPDLDSAEFLTVISDGTQICVNRLQDLAIADSRVIAKLTLASPKSRVSHVFFTTSTETLDAEFRSGMTQVIKPITFVREKRTLQSVKIHASKKLKSIQKTPLVLIEDADSDTE